MAMRTARVGRPKLNRPTDAEIEILIAIAEAENTLTVREIHERIARGNVYNATLKMIQIMESKDLVKRVPKSSPVRYLEAKPIEKTRELLIGDLAKRAFGGRLAMLIETASAMQGASRKIS